MSHERVCEAWGLKKKLEEDEVQKWLTATSYDENLLVGIRSGGIGAYAKVLFDPADPTQAGVRDFKDDPSMELSPEKYLWYMIVELHSGKVPDPSASPTNRMGDEYAEDSPEDDHVQHG